jgi:hypothetical protein
VNALAGGDEQDLVADSTERGYRSCPLPGELVLTGPVRMSTPPWPTWSSLREDTAPVTARHR